MESLEIVAYSYTLVFWVGEFYGPDKNVKVNTVMSSRPVNFTFHLKAFLVSVGYSPSNTMKIMSSWSDYQYLVTLLLSRFSLLSSWPVLVHILLPETDNSPSWISRSKWKTVENTSRSISMKECCLTQRGLNHDLLNTSRTLERLSPLSS